MGASCSHSVARLFIWRFSSSFESTGWSICFLFRVPHSDQIALNIFMTRIYHKNSSVTSSIFRLSPKLLSTHMLASLKQQNKKINTKQIANIALEISQHVKWRCAIIRTQCGLFIVAGVSCINCVIFVASVQEWYFASVLKIPSDCIFIYNSKWFSMAVPLSTCSSIQVYIFIVHSRMLYEQDVHNNNT